MTGRKQLIKTDRKTQSLRQQSAWLLAAKVIAFGFSFMLPLLIVRALTQDAVGHYRLAFQVITNAVIILPLGFSMSAYYFLARETGERRAAAIFNILIFNFVAGGLACLTLFLFPQIIGNIFQSEELLNLAPKIGIVIWIWIFATFLETVAIANQEARAATAFIILSQFSKTLLMGAAVFAFATVESFLYAAMIQGLIQTLILLNYLRIRFPGFWYAFDAGFFRKQMAYAIPFGLSGVLWIAQTDIHNYFVGHKFSPSEFAIYAYGCFELPLIAMLSESITSVLIPRMNALQLANDRDEMIRLMARAMQKLAFFYFPIYVFLMITANTFITTLFTQNYERSTSIFMINLTLLPFSVLIIDPIIRSYKEFGRVFLLTRFLVLMGLVAVLYFGLDHLGLAGMIAAAVGAILIEKLIAGIMVIHKLGLGSQNLPLLTITAKTALISVFAGVVTFVVYSNAHDYLRQAGENFAGQIFSTTQPATLNFVGGSFVLLVSGLVFAPVYLLAANFWGIIEKDEKQAVRNFTRRFVPKRCIQPLTNN
ncbi:MAG: oligosaccharide flippase family protein [Pyrinomonadaceae bacterium]